MARTAKPKPRRQGPSLRSHANGQYTIRIKRKDYYFGTDLEAAQRRRFEILALAAKGQLPPKAVKKSPLVVSEQLTVAELIDTYLDTYFRNPLGCNLRQQPRI